MNNQAVLEIVLGMKQHGVMTVVDTLIPHNEMFMTLFKGIMVYDQIKWLMSFPVYHVYGRREFNRLTSQTGGKI